MATTDYNYYPYCFWLSLLTIEAKLPLVKLIASSPAVVVARGGGRDQLGSVFGNPQLDKESPNDGVGCLLIPDPLGDFDGDDDDDDKDKVPLVSGDIDAEDVEEELFPLIFLNEFLSSTFRSLCTLDKCLRMVSRVRVMIPHIIHLYVMS